MEGQIKDRNTKGHKGDDRPNKGQEYMIPQHEKGTIGKSYQSYSSYQVSMTNTFEFGSFS